VHTLISIVPGSRVSSSALTYSAAEPVGGPAVWRPALAGYGLRKKDTAFAAAWDEAEDIATDSLGDEARRRAIEGVAEPLVSAGNAAREAHAAFQSISRRGHRVGRSTNEANSLEPLRGRAASPAHTLNLAWSRSINFYISSLDFGTRQPRARECEIGRRAATGQTEIPGAGLVRTATGFSLHDRSHVLGGCEHALPLSGLRWRTRRPSSDPGARSSLARRQYGKALMAFVGVVKSGAAFLAKW